MCDLLSLVVGLIEGTGILSHPVFGEIVGSIIEAVATFLSC